MSGEFCTGTRGDRASDGCPTYPADHAEAEVASAPAALTKLAAVFSDGSFCYIPKGVRCPMELSTTLDQIPPVMGWLAALPIGYKLIIVGVAMTVEEAFFRGFLQPRVGLVASSILFAFSHFSYGLPFMIVGVSTISLIIGRAFERTGDLLPCVVAHGIFDGVQLLVILPWAVHHWSSAPLA